jgi:DnaJ-domain-containing protein 1
MGVKRIVEQIIETLDSEKLGNKRKKKALEKLIAKIEDKENALKNRIKSSKSEEDTKKLEKKIMLCVEHRKKGVKALKNISKE